MSIPCELCGSNIVNGMMYTSKKKKEGELDEDLYICDTCYDSLVSAWIVDGKVEKDES